MYRAFEKVGGPTGTNGDRLGRLARVKAAYDPENLFRVNRNIAPAV